MFFLIGPPRNESNPILTPPGKISDLFDLSQTCSPIPVILRSKGKEVGAMKQIREILPRGNEAAFAVGLLLLYAMELFLSPDPEWTIWAAQMAMGVLYFPESPTLQGIAQGDVVRILSAAGTFGTFAAAALLTLRIKTS